MSAMPLLHIYADLPFHGGLPHARKGPIPAYLSHDKCISIFIYYEYTYLSFSLRDTVCPLIGKVNNNRVSFEFTDTTGLLAVSKYLCLINIISQIMLRKRRTREAHYTL